jgi:hypothetical protein
MRDRPVAFSVPTKDNTDIEGTQPCTYASSGTRILDQLFERSERLITFDSKDTVISYLQLYDDLHWQRQDYK